MYMADYRIERQELNTAFRVAKRADIRGREICGMLVRQGNRLLLIPVKNASKSLGSFSIATSHMLIALSAHGLALGQVEGTYHSHPWSPAEPGETDITGADNGSLMLILSCCYKDVRLWRIQDGEAKPVRFIRSRI